MSGPPYLNFYPSDYLADTMDLSCEEHGAYLLLLFTAWNQDDCSLPDDDRKLARICRLSPRKWACVRNAIASFWIIENGRWINARLTAERAKVDQKSNSNRKSANARWDKQGTENKQDRGMRSHSERNAISEPRTQIRDKNKHATHAPPSEKSDEGSLKPEHFVESWNKLATRIGRPKIRKLTPERRTALKARIAGYSLDEFREVLANVERSPFLRGERRWPGVTFDWITKKNNFLKVLEGNYND